mgnify:CR=1 FL=1
MSSSVTSRSATRSFRLFADARKFVHSLNLNTAKEYRAWAKTSERPSDIPAYPDIEYKSNWTGWAEWLGFAPRPYADAQQFAHSLGLRTRDEWEAYVQSHPLPRDIPVHPQNHYKGKGWTTWADWLGRKDGDRFLPFDEARAFARSLRLKSRQEWNSYAQSTARPKNIPSAPAEAYKDTGWAGMGDWLGHHTKLNRIAILAILDSLRQVVCDLTPAEIYAILSRNGLVGKSFCANGNANILKSLIALCRSPDPTSLLNALADELEASEKESDDQLDAADAEAVNGNIPIVSPDIFNEATALPELRSLDSLKSLDRLESNGMLANDLITFLVTSRVNALWQAVLDGNRELTLERLHAEQGGAYFQLIRTTFEEQYQAAVSLPIPEGYSFLKNGQLQPPNLMQRLTASRLLTVRRTGNWSGTGSGKMLAAILASRVLNARLTVIVTVNATLDRWQDEILKAYPDSRVLTKDSGPMNLDTSRPNYLVLNFEAFQQKRSHIMVQTLLAGQVIDFVVLDEVQSVRQRTPAGDSQRRALVQALISGAEARNPELRVLGMSATPVINTLHEAKALLELITGTEHKDLHIKPSIANAIATHQQLLLHGFRYRPQYPISIDKSVHVIDGLALLDVLRKVPPRALLKWEQTMLHAKLPQIASWLRSGTLVYTQFVEGMVEPLADAIRKVGLRPGVFTGDIKDGLKTFLSKEVDVLIGSAPISTGVDGLQAVCNRVIFACLPWTSAEYDQIIGRLHRQGSVFDKVEVLIPQVVLCQAGREWSWDRLRLRRIEWKRTLADAAIDGVIPEGQLPSKEEMQQQSLAALEEWAETLRSDGLLEPGESASERFHRQ